MKTRIFILLAILGLGILTACYKDDASPEFDSTGTILGYDLSLCACCGGYIIEIDGQESDYRFSELPQNADIDLVTSDFPIDVKLNWSESNDYCGKGIIIESIALAD